MTSLAIKEDDGSYMLLTDMHFTESNEGRTALFTFTNTKDPRKRTSICMPTEDTSPSSLESIFHSVNQDYPEHAEHLDMLAPYLGRLEHAKT